MTKEKALTETQYEKTLEYLYKKAENRSKGTKDKPKMKNDTPQNNSCEKLTTISIQMSRKHSVSSAVLDAYYDGESRAYKVSIVEERIPFWLSFQLLYYSGKFEKTETIDDFLSDIMDDDEVGYSSDEDDDPFNVC